MIDPVAKIFAEIEERLMTRSSQERFRAVDGLQRPSADTLRDSLGEARHILGHLPVGSMIGKRVLEVGAGLGIVSACLEKIGVLVEGVEPAGEAFQDSPRLRPLLRELLQTKFVLHPCAVHALSSDGKDRYDLIFSHNVLEHMTDLEKSFKAMGRLLAPGGVAVHSCPNYFIPYEPHYGVWLFPFFPGLTWFFSRSIRKDPVLWRSLNFVTAGRIKKIARRIGGTIRFKNGTMYEALLRLENDPFFTIRQNGWPCRIHGWLKQTALLKWVRHIPARWSTPMVFYLTTTARMTE